MLGCYPEYKYKDIVIDYGSYISRLESYYGHLESWYMRYLESYASILDEIYS